MGTVTNLRAIFAMVFLCPIGALAQEQIYVFQWNGAGGYSMTGALSFDSRDLTGPMIMADDVQCFEIEGYVGDTAIGSWGLGQLTEKTSWRLHFVPSQPAFVVDGFWVRMPQAWNMNGAGSDCGIGGFGFNIGNIGQDLCVDNHVIVESRIAPHVPFPVIRDDSYVFGADACRAPMVLGALQH